MPKIVDHRARREELAQAAIDLMAEQGLAAASVRAVAQRAACSAGAMRHYFPDHQGLLRFAGEHLTEQLSQRIGAIGFEGAEEDAPARVCRLCEELLPLDERRRRELIAYTELASLDREDAYWRGYRQEQNRRLRAFAERCVGLLAAARERDGRQPEVPTGTDGGPAGERGRAELTQRLARRLHWCVDGLAAQEIIYPGALAPQLMREHLAEVVADLDAELAVDP